MVIPSSSLAWYGYSFYSSPSWTSGSLYLLAFSNISNFLFWKRRRPLRKERITPLASTQDRTCKELDMQDFSYSLMDVCARSCLLPWEFLLKNNLPFFKMYFDALSLWQSECFNILVCCLYRRGHLFLGSSTWKHSLAFQVAAEHLSIPVHSWYI